MAHLNRQRAERLLSDAGLDALILLSPESFRHATGAEPGVATMWRRAGAVAVLVPTDPVMPETAIVSDLFAESFRRQSHIADVRESPIWVETSTLDRADPGLSPEALIANAWAAQGRATGFTRPATFDPQVCYTHLARALADRGLANGRIGIEAAAISAADYPALQSALSAATLVDATEIVARLKMVKSPAEISALQQAVTLAERGIGAVSGAIAPGITRNDLAQAWAGAIKANPDQVRLTGSWEYISVGPDPWGGNAAVQPGDLVKVDVGCLVDGYTSDTGRTFVLGPPSALQARIHAALMQGFVTGSAMLRPGMKLAEVHRATQSAIRAAGFASFCRGHFGHGLGAGLGSEEWPFIAADSAVVIEPGMVLAFECPWYIKGLGGFIIENQVLIGADGPHAMNRLPVGLVEVGF